MKKGFTLIELLAVIVILAIISAIAIPIVIKVIDNVKVGSLKVSMSNIEKAIEIYINKTPINDNKTFTCSNGICIDTKNNKLELTGTVPEDGTITITPSGRISYNKLIIDGYLCDKYNEEFVCNKASKKIEETKQKSIIIKATTTNLDNYKIYGESVQNATPTSPIPIEVESVGDNTKNLVDYSTVTNSFSSPIKNIIITDEYIDVQNKGQYIYNKLKLPKLKANTTYTLYYEVEIYDRDEGSDYTMIVAKFSPQTDINPQKSLYNNGDKYKRTITYTPTEDITNATVIFNTNYGSKVYARAKWKIMVVEGSYTLDNIPTYEPYGKYKISVKVNGKNLVDINKSIVGYTLSANGSIVANSNYDVSEYIRVEPNTTYTLQKYNNYKTTGAATNSRCFGYDENKTQTSLLGEIPLYDVGIGTTTFTTGPNDKYVRISIRHTDTKFQLEKGSKATDYEPYYGQITTIYLDEPLRKVGDYVDYIDYKNQKEIRNVGVLKLNSADNFELIDNYFVLSLESYPKKDIELSISNYLEYGNNFWISANKLKLRIEGINTIEELKTWLSDKNVEIYYPLSKSIVSDRELPEINLNKNYSNITIDSKIKPSNMLIEYE